MMNGILPDKINAGGYRMATIQEVAQLAGVSTATVSRVLNENYKVSDKRRKAVLDAVKALNYRPNIIGRNLSRSENKTILVVSSVTDNKMLLGVHHAAKELGYDVILSYTGMSDGKDALKYFENGLAGGMLFINFIVDYDMLVDLIKNYPVVQCAEYIDIPESCLVSIHDDTASYELTELLIKQGRKRFAFLGPVSESGHIMNYPILRERGFKQALSDYGVPYYPSLTMHISRRYDQAVKTAKEIASMDPSERPDAVVCAVDEIGTACVNTFRNMGISVPDTIAVTGFDNSIYSTMCTPMLTTVKQPFFEMGAESTKLLVSIMNGKKPEKKRVYLPHTLVIRGSTDPNAE